MGRAELAIVAQKVRELTEEDMMNLGQPAAEHSGGGDGLKRLRQAHHKIAFLMATGYKNVEISAMTGYSATYLSTLENDPAFENLLAAYKAKATQLHANTLEQLHLLTTDAIGTIHERLLETPESFTNRDLMALIQTAADRSGHGPTSQVNHTHVGISADQLDKLKERADGRQQGTVRDVSSDGDAASAGTPQDEQAQGDLFAFCGEDAKAGGVEPLDAEWEEIKEEERRESAGEDTGEEGGTPLDEGA